MVRRKQINNSNNPEASESVKYCRISNILNKQQWNLREVPKSFPKAGKVYHFTNQTDDFVYESLQFALTGITTRSILIKNEEWTLVQGGCRGCKVCNVCGMINNTKSRAQNCKKTQCSGQYVVEKCPTKVYYAKRGTDRLLYLHEQHSHPNPPPRKVPKRIEAVVSQAFMMNPTLTAKDVMKGIGIPKSPF